MEGEMLKLTGWCRKVTGHGVVYYVRRGSSETRWVHPGLAQCVYSLAKYDNIRYAAYRLSSKLIEIQTVLAASSVSLALTQSVLAHHGLSTPTMMLDWAELRHFLSDLYHRATRARGVFSMYPEQHEVYTEALASFVEQALDPTHQGGVTVLGLKTILAVLTSARLRDRLAYLFREHSDHQARLSESGLTFLLTILARVPEILGEGVMFGSGVVHRGVFSCLQAGGGRVVTEEVWMSWASREPPELVWLTTSYRQSASSKVQHAVKCSACHAVPIIGMRYQCLQCLSYDLCQNCFFVGVATKGHKPKHPVQEYCYPSTKKEEAKAFLATLANKFKARQSQPRGRRKITRALTADRIANKARPQSLQSSKSSHSKLSSQTGKSSQSKLSQLLIRVSPRSSMGESKSSSSPRCSIGDRLDKASPVSSGFCSGEEFEASPTAENQNGARSEAAGVSPASPLPSASPDTPDSPPSPIYEPLIEEQPLELESPGLEWDDNGIELGHRTIDDTDNTDLEILEQINNFENSIFRKDLETGEMRCYQHNTKRRVKRRDQMTSILGHLEDDHKRLQERLETASPDLVQPVLDAQSQLNRLKDLMQGLFKSQYSLNDTSRAESHVTYSVPTNNEDILLEYTYANVDKQADLKEDNVKPAESTRLEIFKNIQTPRVKFDATNLDFFSPITSVIKSQLERDYPEEKEELLQDQNPSVTFNCISPRVEDERFDDELTKYNLSDLSKRLGGTGLYISRDNGLDITDQLENDVLDDQEEKSPNDTTKYAETMDELEKLMVRLSDVFQTFREPPECKTNSEDDKLLDNLVNGIDEDIYGFLCKSKESCI